MRISVVIDAVDPDALTGFWSAALGYRLASAPGAFRVLVPDAGEPAGPPVILQQVPDPGAGKNRVHVDVHPPDAAAHHAALEALGGQRVGAPVTELLASLDIWWQVMADPAGNLLCVVADPGQPGPT